MPVAQMFENCFFLLVDELKCGRGLPDFFQGKSYEAQAGHRFAAAGPNNFSTANFRQNLTNTF